MRTRRFLPAAASIILLILSSAAVSGAPYLTADDVTASLALLTPPPADGSSEQKAEIQTLLDLQAKRTPADETRIEANSHLTGFLFADVIGPWFNKKDLPVTTKLLSDVGLEVKAAYTPAKAKFHRDRPFVTDPRITPSLAKESGFSYPSGHATGGMTYALILAEMFPEHKDALLARGKQVGEDREMGGVHYPSDVAAGQKIGAEIAKRLLANAAFRAEMEKAVEECHADMAAAK